MILRNYFLINLVLLILIAFLGVKAFNAFSVSVVLPSEVVPSEAVPAGEPITPKIVFSGESVFQVIPDKNIFSPTRALVVRKSETGLDKAVPQEIPKLFGTLITGSSKSAMLKDPITKSIKRYFVDDAVGDFVVNDIQQDLVILIRGDETIELNLRSDKGTVTTTTNIPTRKERIDRTIIPAPKINKSTPMDEEDAVETTVESPKND